MKKHFLIIICLAFVSCFAGAINAASSSVPCCPEIASETKEIALSVSRGCVDQPLSLERSYSISSLIRHAVNISKLFFSDILASASENAGSTGFRLEVFQRNPFKCSYYFMRLCVLSSQAHPPTK